MAFHIKDDFQPGAPVSSIGVSWFNSVASFLNRLVGGFGIKVTKNDNGVSTVEIDGNDLRDLGFAYDPNTVLSTKAEWVAAAPKDVKPPASGETDAQKIARVGKSNVAAPIDHVHRMEPHDHSWSEVVCLQNGSTPIYLSVAMGGIAEVDDAQHTLKLKPPQNGSDIQIGGADLASNVTPMGAATSYEFHSTASDRRYVTVLIACRSGQDGTTGNLYFRPMTISPDGRIVSIGAEAVSAMAFADAAQVQ